MLTNSNMSHKSSPHPHNSSIKSLKKSSPRKSFLKSLKKSSSPKSLKKSSSPNSSPKSFKNSSPHNSSPHNSSPKSFKNSSPHNSSPHNSSSHNSSPHNSSPHNSSPHNSSPKSVKKSSSHNSSPKSVKKSSPHNSSPKSVKKSSSHNSSPKSVKKSSSHNSSPKSVKKSSSHKSHSSIKQPRSEYLVDELYKQFNKGHENMFRVEYVDENDKNGKLIKEYRIYQTDQKCASVSIIETDGMGEILVLAIDKCSSSGVAGSGKHILNCLIEFSEKEGFSLVIEVDVSKITIGGIDFSLTGLYMLTTGHSWYNSMGFYEENYEENKRKTDEFIKEYTWTNTADFKKYIYEPMIAKSSLKSSSKSKDKIKFTIQQVFKYIMDQLKNTISPPDHNELEFYSKFLKIYQTKLFNHPDPEKRVSYKKTYMLTYKRGS